MAAVDNLPANLKLSTSPAPGAGFKLGDWKEVAKCIKHLNGKQTNDGITASATQTQVAGTKVTYGFTKVGTVTTSNDAVTFPMSGAGHWLFIVNTGGNTMQAFPGTGDAINAAGANNAVTIANLTTSLYVCTLRGQWWGGAITNEQ